MFIKVSIRFFFIILFLGSPIFAEEVNFEDLVIKKSDGLTYLKFTTKPFSGSVSANEKHPFSGDFHKGLRDGQWDYFHPNGLLKESGEFIKGKKEGFWETFDKEGNTSEKIHYSNDQTTNGNIREFDYKNRIEFDYIFDEGREISRVEYLYVPHLEKPICKIFFESQKEIKREVYQYYSTGKNQLSSKRTYAAASNEILSKIESTYDIVKVFTELGTLHGPYERFHINGQPSTKGFFKDGYLNGFYERFYENGMLELKDTRINGWAHGKRLRFYIDGSLAEEDEFIEGVLYKNGIVANGEYQYLFSQDGPVRRTVNYVDGLRHGLESIYNLDGEVQVSWLFENGKLVDN